MAFRTGEDSPSLAGKGRIAWADGPILFYLSRRGLPSTISEEDLPAVLEKALTAWQSPPCASVQPSFAGWTDEAVKAQDGLNTIAWVADWRERGLPASAPGNTDLAYRGKAFNWRIAEADVLLNADDFDWSMLSTEAVLTHELGHALGLLHPCEDNTDDGAPLCQDATPEVRSSTMYPDYDPTHTGIEQDDADGICYLYPTRSECNGGCGPHQKCVDDVCHALCGEAVCEVGQACGAWGCAPEDSCLDLDCQGRSCEQGPDCGPLLSCVSGTCTSGSSHWGDHCDANQDCANGACVRHTCQPVCQSDAECGANGTCEGADGNAMGCVSSGAYEFGTHCAVGEDCASGLCVFTDSSSACTVPCDTSAACPAAWKCDTVNRRRVCVPPVDSGGCSLAYPAGARLSLKRILGPRSVGSPTLIFAAAALVAARRRRRKK